VTSIVVLGGSFAGINAAFELELELGQAAEITVVARDSRFVFLPSLVWVPPGWRKPGQISMELAPVLYRRGIKFLHATAERIDPDQNTVFTDKGDLRYDYLLIATGARHDWSVVPGLGPITGNTHSICNIAHAMDAAEAWLHFVQDPGPVVIGSAQGASCFGAAYEMVFNIDRALRQAKIRDRAPLAFVTAEPFLGHFGLGGMRGAEPMLKAYFKLLGITPFVNVGMTAASEGSITLTNGRELRHKYAIVIPPFTGAQAILDSPGLGDQKGFIPVNDYYQHTSYENIYAAGVAVQIKPEAPTEIPTGVPKTGWMSEVMGKVAAHNVVVAIQGGEPRKLPFADIKPLCIMDAGSQGMIIVLDRVFRPRRYEIMIPGPWSHWAKLAFEKYYLTRIKHGLVYLP
jgi:sulfide:quinone oxidoreductase